MSTTVYINDDGREVRINCDDDGPCISIRDGERDIGFWADNTVTLHLSPANLDALEAAIQAARVQLAREAA